MRKRNVTNFFDNVLWYFVYMFPLLVILVMSIKAGDFINLSEFFTGYGYNVFSNGIIYDSLNSLFGASGILPLFTAESGVLYYAAWFVSCMLVHLAVDFILFIPRLAHKYMEKFTQGE